MMTVKEAIFSEDTPAMKVDRDLQEHLRHERYYREMRKAIDEAYSRSLKRNRRIYIAGVIAIWGTWAVLMTGMVFIVGALSGGAQ